MVCFFNPTESIEEMLNLADQALYKTKEYGRNRTEIISIKKDCLSKFSDPIKFQIVRLHWKEEYESGNLLIDSQHRHLFTCSNELLNAIITGQTDKIVLDSAKNLLTHTVQHFFEEEKIIYESEFSEVKNHCNIHRQLEKKMSQTIAHFKKDKVHVGELFSFLVKDVILGHMVLEDKKFFPYLE